MKKLIFQSWEICMLKFSAGYLLPLTSLSSSWYVQELYQCLLAHTAFQPEGEALECTRLPLSVWPSYSTQYGIFLVALIRWVIWRASGCKGLWPSSNGCFPAMSTLQVNHPGHIGRCIAWRCHKAHFIRQACSAVITFPALAGELHRWWPALRWPADGSGSSEPHRTQCREPAVSEQITFVTPWTPMEPCNPCLKPWVPSTDCGD